MLFPTPNAHLPIEVLENFPGNLLFTGYFAAYLTRDDLVAMHEQFGLEICEPEVFAPGMGGSDRQMREVMSFREEVLTGREIADILKVHGNWFVFYDFVLQDPSTA